MFTLPKRIIKLGWQSFSRDGGLIAANIFIIVMMLSVATSLFIMKDVSQFLISSIQEKVDVSVYFKLDTVEEKHTQDIAIMEIKHKKHIDTIQDQVDKEIEGLQKIKEQYQVTTKIIAWFKKIFKK